jgi:O-antigen biosynthesis protein WbqP
MRATTRREALPDAAPDSANMTGSGALTERLKRAYVAHALADALPRRRHWLPKRALDLVVALPLLIIALPLSLAITLSFWVRFHRRATVAGLYAGRGGRIFTLRLRDAVSGEAHPDALSALWRVVTGEMSLVGPAPWPSAAFTGRPARELARLYVAPGALRLRPIGRLRRLDVTQAEADLRYVTDGSLWLDIEQLAAATLAPSRRFRPLSPSSERSEPSTIRSQEGSATL